MEAERVLGTRRPNIPFLICFWYSRAGDATSLQWHRTFIRLWVGGTLLHEEMRAGCAGKCLTTCSLGSQVPWYKYFRYGHFQAPNTTPLKQSWDGVHILRAMADESKRQGRKNNRYRSEIDQNSAKVKSKNRMTRKDESHSQDSLHVFERMLIFLLGIGLHKMMPSS